MNTAPRFEFGRNWSQYLAVLDDERIKRAEDSLKAALGLKTLKGKSFVDIGCGSGLFSLAALRLGAAVHSIDCDADSVQCTQLLRERYFPNHPRWAIERASVLDQTYLETLGQFDVVYSWGVLHHTGEMWKALSNVVGLVKPEGRLFIAIYNDMGSQSRRWRAVKKRYVSSGRAGKWAILFGVCTALALRESAVRLVRMQNPIPLKEWRSYKQKRGMAAWYDLVDWVGGYPYEVARPEEIFAFYKTRGFDLDYMTTGGLGCNEFVFTRTDSCTLALTA
jgi:2-polyprenyl-6-hydroxyphenyl methylase/3-demethylubiquinone-9 3-methyltransferase